MVSQCQRKVWITVPGDVWFILDKLGFCNVGLNWGWHCLELLKAMYGLVDAPVLWSIALRFFVIRDMHGLPSRYDENFFYWLDPKAPDCQFVAVCTIHVDDLVLAASKGWLETTYKAFVRKFEKVKRQTRPFTNIGMAYSRTDHGGTISTSSWVCLQS